MRDSFRPSLDHTELKITFFPFPKCQNTRPPSQSPRSPIQCCAHSNRGQIFTNPPCLSKSSLRHDFLKLPLKHSKFVESLRRSFSGTLPECTDKLGRFIPLDVVANLQIAFNIRGTSDYVFILKEATAPHISYSVNSASGEGDNRVRGWSESLFGITFSFVGYWPTSVSGFVLSGYFDEGLNSFSIGSLALDGF
jgi:hypothetical protein